MSVYTGKTEQPCCLCDDPETAARLDLPPRTIKLMKHSDPVAWRDVVGSVSIHFCADDWATVRDLVLDLGGQPLSRCNVARASFDIREDFEALLNDVRDEPDQTKIEREALTQARETLVARDDDMTEDRDLVEALVVRRALAELGVADPDPVVGAD